MVSGKPAGIKGGGVVWFAGPLAGRWLFAARGKFRGEPRRDETGRDLPDTGARRLYNGNVREFNNRCEMFPTNILASMFHFERAEFFEIESAVERAASKVDLGGTK